MDLMTMIIGYIRQEAELATTCESLDCRHPVDHPLPDLSGDVTAFTCYNAQAFAAGLAAYLERCYQEVQAMHRQLVEKQHADYQRWLTSPEGQETMRRELLYGAAILRGDVMVERMSQDGSVVRVTGKDGRVLYEGAGAPEQPAP